MIYILLPSYNEEENVAPQLNNILDILKDKEFKIVIVDDGSRDNTIKEIDKFKDRMRIEVVEHKTNKGVGIAFKTGFDKLRNELNDDDIVITMDFDNTQHINTINLMLNKVREGYEVVNGSVFTMGGMLIGVAFIRYFLAFVCNFLYRIIFHIKGIHDYTGFFRAHKGSALKALYDKFGDNMIESKGFTVMAELMIKYRLIPLFVTEVPMIVKYHCKKGESKMKIIPTIKEHIKLISKFIFKRGIF